MTATTTLHGEPFSTHCRSFTMLLAVAVDFRLKPSHVRDQNSLEPSQIAEALRIFKSHNFPMGFFFSCGVFLVNIPRGILWIA